MQQTLNEQTGIFLWSLVMGAVLAAGYTVLAAARILSPPGRRQLFWSDFLFMAAAALLNLLFALAQTYGRIRGYVLAAELTSFFLLYGTVGRLVCRSIFVLKKLVMHIWERLTAPLRRVCGGLGENLVKKCRKMLPFSKKT